MTRIILLSTAIVAGLVAASGVSAQGGARGQMERPSFAQLDADGDGLVTVEEMQAFPAARAAERFQAADTNGDGSISAEELTASIEQLRNERMAARAEAMMSRLDTDGDGAISEEEMTANMGRNQRSDRGTRFIDWADTDNDGAVSEAEFDAMADKMQQRADRGGKGKKGPRGDRAPFWRN